ncbi:MAG: phosphate-starvation-inducible PsiE family protein [Acidimicrobiales bacterium]
MTNESGGDPGGPSMAPVVSRAMRIAENVIYCLVSLVLFGAAVLLLGQSGYHLVTTVSENVGKAVRETLDTLLLVFILVELLSATRETMNQRKIVAEPFLLVGIIASIKEVVLLGIGAKDDLRKDKEAFESAMLGIGTISGLLLVLSVAILLVRRKEREPEED